MVNCDHYSYRVTWSVEDSEFVGLCAEYPSLSYLDEDRYAAIEGITNLVKDIVADNGIYKQEIPLFAAEENVSLNRYISHKLAN